MKRTFEALVQFPFEPGPHILLHRPSSEGFKCDLAAEPGATTHVLPEAGSIPRRDGGYRRGASEIPPRHDLRMAGRRATVSPVAGGGLLADDQHGRDGRRTRLPVRHAV